MTTNEPPFKLMCRDRGERALILVPTQQNEKSSLIFWEGTSITFLPAEGFDETGFALLSPAYGIIGLLPYRRDVYVGIVVSTTTAGVIEGSIVYRIATVRFYSLTNNIGDSGSPTEYMDQQTGQMQPHPCVDVHKYLSSGMFYFSYTHDLTSCAQRRSLRPNSSPADTVNERFLFNRYLLKDLIRIAPRTNTPHPPLLFCTQGFVAIQQGFIQTTRVNVILISRLSSDRIGTRFHARGINDSGHVANFVETEQIVTVDGCTLSFVQVRGSVPIFWTQRGLQLGAHRIELVRSVPATASALRRHLENLHYAYGAIRIVNLLSQKGAEGTLSDAYRRTLATIDDPLVRVTNFDSHYYCRESFENISMLISELGRDFNNFKCFLRNDIDGSVVTKQEGSFRTNCIDCLDRTNMAQTAIARKVLEVNFPAQINVRTSAIFNNFLSEMWANNGDAISIIYAGTGALRSDFTRTGKRTVVGMLDDAMKSVNRMYVNTFLDDSRQYIIDALVGKLNRWQAITTIIRHPLQDEAENLLQSTVEANCRMNRSIYVHIGTWNVNCRQPNGESLVPWLTFDTGGRRPDLYVIGFQELVPLSAKQLMSTDESKLAFWEDLLQKNLNSIHADKRKQEYILLRSEQLVGACLCIFIKTELVPYIRNVESSICKTGLAGIAGNKGGVAIRLDVGETSICFICAHMAAGQSNVDDRNRDYQTITDGIQFPFAGSIDKHENIFWLGDFNYRVDLSNEETRWRCSNNDVKTLLAYDQLNNSRQQGRAFKSFQEAEITFLPTYKYDVGTHVYDTSEKMRIPAWTDRVLWLGSSIQNLYYQRSELVSSDHKPVKALFDLDVVIEDAQLRKQLERVAYHEMPGVLLPFVLEDEMQAELQRRKSLEIFPPPTAPRALPSLPPRSVSSPAPTPGPYANRALPQLPPRPTLSSEPTGALPALPPRPRSVAPPPLPSTPSPAVRRPAGGVFTATTTANLLDLTDNVVPGADAPQNGGSSNFWWEDSNNYVVMNEDGREAPKGSSNVPETWQDNDFDADLDLIEPGPAMPPPLKPANPFYDDLFSAEPPPMVVSRKSSQTSLFYTSQTHGDPLLGQSTSQPKTDLLIDL